jgi:hypothetical protein
LSTILPCSAEIHSLLSNNFRVIVGNGHSGDGFYIANLYDSGHAATSDEGATYAAENALSDEGFLKAIAARRNWPPASSRRNDLKALWSEPLLVRCGCATCGI